MTATAAMLFNVQKFQIFSLFTSESSIRNVTPAYAFAWDRGVYPLLDDSAPWHKPYGEFFEVSEEMVNGLLKFLDERWSEKNPITFYELEDHYEIRAGETDWDRGTLIGACRYFRLHELFDEDFWRGLVGHSDCPSESHGITRDIGPEDIYFL